MEKSYRCKKIVVSAEWIHFIYFTWNDTIWFYIDEIKMVSVAFICTLQDISMTGWLVWVKSVWCLISPDITHGYCYVINVYVITWQPKLYRLGFWNCYKLNVETAIKFSMHAYVWKWGLRRKKNNLYNLMWNLKENKTSRKPYLISYFLS